MGLDDITKMYLNINMEKKKVRFFSPNRDNFYNDNDRAKSHCDHEFCQKKHQLIGGSTPDTLEIVYIGSASVLLLFILYRLMR